MVTNAVTEHLVTARARDQPGSRFRRFRPDTLEQMRVSVRGDRDRRMTEELRHNRQRHIRRQ